MEKGWEWWREGMGSRRDGKVRLDRVSGKVDREWWNGREGRKEIGM